MISVLIVDDHIMLRIGLRATLEGQADIDVVGEAETGDEALEHYERLKPDVVIMDLRMPGGGLETIKRLVAVDPRVSVLVYSNYASSEEITQSFELGAAGFVVKDMPPEALLEGVRTVCRGQQFVPPEVSFRMSKRVLSKLSNREIEVLKQISKGQSNKEIAAALNLVEGTVKVHISNILSKLKVADRTQAVMSGVRQGLIEIE